MKNYEHDDEKYLLPLKINLAHSKKLFCNRLFIFLTLTLPSVLIILWIIEAAIKKGFDVTAFTLITCLLFGFTVSLALIHPRHLLIDTEKIQVRCFIFKKQLYWANAKTLSSHISDVAYASKNVSYNPSTNLHMHKANQTSPGQKVGIKRYELSSLNYEGKLRCLHFNIAIDSGISLEMLDRTIYSAYRGR